MMHLFIRRSSIVGLVLGLASAPAVAQQDVAPGVLPGVKHGGSPNVHLLGHIPLGGYFRVMDNEIEQELSRPYAYVSQSRDRQGFTIIDLHDVEHPRKLYSWVIENHELHGGTGGMDGKYFKIRTKSGPKYYYVQSLQFGGSGPDADLGAVVADVTGLPDTNKVKIVARLRFPEAPGGFHNMFAYKHSDGRVLLFVTVTHPYALVYDMEKVLSGTDPAQGLIGKVPIPESANTQLGNFGYHDFQVFYDPKTRLDKFYGAGRGGYFLYDVTKIGREDPRLITSIVGSSGITGGHTFTPVPNQDIAVTEAEYQYAPLRIFDLTPGLEGRQQTVNRSVGAWTADWRDLSHNHEVKWPFVFVSAYEDGLQVFNLVDQKHPQTVGWYYTCECQHERGFGGVPNWEGTSVMQGAFGVKVRDADGLIIISDSNTGFWSFRMDGFGSWKGEDWGMPNVSSSQDWDRGPVVATGSTQALIP
jgi:hypothetical protein